MEGTVVATQETSANQFVSDEVKAKVEHYAQRFQDVRKEIGKAVIGQQEMVSLLLEALIANGHVLLEGVPGIGKTLLVCTVSKIIGCSSLRTYFLPILLV
jgi:MoxR-like ATPase